MPAFEIFGGKKLKGEIRVSGAKNAALKFMAAALIADGPVDLKNVPEIEDIHRLAEILREIGVTVKQPQPHQYIIDAGTLETGDLPSALAPKIRASLLLIGPLLVRLGRAILPRPGGCAIGKRPIDFFEHGFRAFGADVSEGDDEHIFKAKKLRAARFIFPLPSVTGTEALLMTAVRVPGTTTLINAAMEPEIVALAEFLNACGARISGAGTSVVVIEGVSNLSGGEATMIPDRIEAGSFAALAAATDSDITITGCNPAHLDVPLLVLEKIGVRLDVSKDAIRIKSGGTRAAIHITTHEYPGFPTDLQAPFTVLLTQADGVSRIHETIFDGRLLYTESLKQMGAKVVLANEHVAVVEGPSKLRGKTLESPDIRAGLALVIAALAAKGKSTIGNAYQIDRGYERIEERLRDLGAAIQRVNVL